jgi:hypothetical protein
LVVDWYRACVEAGLDSITPPAQVLSFSVSSIDGRPVQTPSLVGFTISFTDANTVELLRLESPPIGPSEIDVSWSNPPSSLRIELPEEVERIIKDSILKDHLRELEFLEYELDRLKHLISAKKQTIADHLATALKEEVERCDGFFCVAKAIVHHIKTSASLLCQKFRKNNPFGGDDPLNQTQKPTMISFVDDDKKTPSSNVTRSLISTTATTLPEKPEKCHYKDEKRCRYLQLTDEPTDDDASYSSQGHFRDIPPSKLWIVLQFFLLITGIALICRLVRRCFTSPQKERDRAARREQRRTEREYRCASQRQAFWDWMKGRKRGKPGRRPGDLDEKSALVGQQEAVLNEHMEDEIRQLKIHEEIRNLQSTREAVTDMIRAAEEGRATYIGSPAAPPYNTNPFADSSPYHTSPYLVSPSIPQPAYPSTDPYAYPYTSILPRPIPITIPPRDHSRYPTLASPTSSSDMPFSPMSRTTSLPSYRSKPPSYRENASSDGFSSTDSETHSTDGAWSHSDNSSIPSLSPRPSGETLRTETVRSFL